MSFTVYSVFLSHSLICSLDRVTFPFGCRAHIDHDISVPFLVESQCLVPQHWCQCDRPPWSGQGASLTAGKTVGNKCSQTCTTEIHELGKQESVAQQLHSHTSICAPHFINTHLGFLKFTWSNHCLIGILLYKVTKILFFRKSTHTCT